MGRSFNATGASQGGRERRLVARAGISITKMACTTPGVMEQETFVMSVIEGTPEALLDGDVLVLRTDVAEIRFLDQQVADPDRPLEVTRWRVTGQFDPQVASASATPAGEVVLSSGRLRFTDACQDAEGPTTVAGTTVTVGALSQSPPGPCSQQQQNAEADVLRLLTGIMKADISASNLTLTRSDGTDLTLVDAR